MPNNDAEQQQQHIQTSLSAIQQQLNSFTNTFKILSERIEKIGSDLSDVNNNVSGLSNKFDDFKDLLEKKVDDVKTKVDNVETRVDKLEIKVQQQEDFSRRSCNLLLSGVPFAAGENVGEIFCALSAALGFDSPPEADVFRIPGPNNSKRSIVLKFPTEFHKDKFLRCYFANMKNVTLSIFPGFEEKKDRVYLQHDLTLEQYKLLRAAKDKKKEGKIDGYFVKKGEILIRFCDGGAHRKFDSADVFLDEFNCVGTSGDVEDKGSEVETSSGTGKVSGALKGRSTTKPSGILQAPKLNAVAKNTSGIAKASGVAKGSGVVKGSDVEKGSDVVKGSDVGKGSDVVKAISKEVNPDAVKTVVGCSAN